VPAQLPAGLAVFAARGAGLAGVAETIGQRGGDVAIVVVTGIAGVGKSTFAVHLAHRIADRFPDGVLHLDLRGFDPSGRVMSAAEALHVLLTSIGVPMADMPPGEDALGALLRTRTAGRRILMVLDNVRDSAQVRPLLPAGGGCAVVVTSRNQLADLVITHDALPVPLGPLVYGEARELLTRRLGANRLAADPAAVDGIIRRCAGLPLALAVVAGRAALYPDFPLAAIAAELHAADGTLDGFTGSADATDVRSVFSWSYRSLGEPAARMFRLIGVHPGPDLTAAAAASLAALPAASAAALLRELVRVNLLTEKAPGRFEPHDLLRVYAAELAGDDPVARRRILDHYAVTAYDAQRIVNRTRRPFPRIVPGPGVGPETPADPASATAWFAAEKGVLRAAVAMAARHGLDEHAFVMSFSMSPFFKRQGGRDLAAAMAEAALGAAERLGDRMMTGRVLGWQAGIHGDAGDVTAAERGFARAIVIFTELGDQEHLMSVHEAVIVMLAGHGRFEEIYTRSERLLALARGIGDESRVASALNSLAYAAVELGRYENALPPAQESLEIFLRLDLPRDAGGSLDTIGHVQAHLGALEAAAESFERSLELFRAVDERTYMADVLDHLAEVRARLGDPAAARTAWETALTYDDAMRPALAAAIREKLAAL
jgi:tetratricopeptide (TPR) repeat protein